jgi:hypothetical protein
MKHSSSRELYDYWNTCRGRRPAPERAEIDPTAIPRVLADTFLLGADGGGEFVFRLAGTRVCALFCREIKGEQFVALFGGRNRSVIGGLVTAVCDESTATVAGVTGRFDDAACIDLELLLLPLCHRGRTDSRLLGVLAPLARSVWIGAMPVAALTLGTLRHISSVEGTPDLGQLPVLLRDGRIRHGLVVYEGGRSS